MVNRWSTARALCTLWRRPRHGPASAADRPVRYRRGILQERSGRVAHAIPDPPGIARPSTCSSNICGAHQLMGALYNSGAAYDTNDQKSIIATADVDLEYRTALDRSK